MTPFLGRQFQRYDFGKPQGAVSLSKSIMMGAADAPNAATTTPTPASQIMLAVPLCVLYEIGIWTARLLVRRRGESVAASSS